MKHTVYMTFDADGRPVPMSADRSQIERQRVVERHDEIRWLSDHGTVTVEFQNETPFAHGIRTGGGTFQTISGADGTHFDYNCTITTPDGKHHGWRAGHSGSGGTVAVGGGRNSA